MATPVCPGMLAEPGFPTPVALRRDVERRALFLDQRPDAVSVIFTGRDDGVLTELIEKLVGGLAGARLPSGQAQAGLHVLARR